MVCMIIAGPDVLHVLRSPTFPRPGPKKRKRPTDWYVERDKEALHAA